MKNLIIMLSLFLVGNTVIASNAKFETAMEQTLGKYAQCQSPQDFQALANSFEVIAKAEPNEWLPIYYQTNCLILMSFMERSADKKDAILVPVESLIKKMIALVPEESEIYVLESMFYSAKLVVNPMERGQKYGALSNQSIQKALTLAPNNPRAKYMQIQNELGTTAFFKQDLKPIYVKAQVVLNEWDEYKVPSDLYPNWGKDQLIELIASSK